MKKRNYPFELIFTDILLFYWHSWKCFICSNSFNPHDNPWGVYYHLHFRDEETEGQRRNLCVPEVRKLVGLPSCGLNLDSLAPVLLFYNYYMCTASLYSSYCPLLLLPSFHSLKKSSALPSPTFIPSPYNILPSCIHHHYYSLKWSVKFVTHSHGQSQSF